MTKVFTIGVYGFTEDGFFNALSEAKIDMFCDIRARRGLRGSKYSFANSKYLQNKLQQLEICYIHLKDLAPSQETRILQQEMDKSQNTAKRDRTQLGKTFIQAYKKEVLDNFDPNVFMESLKPLPKRLVLFCVEREPNACHRSLVATKLAMQLDVSVEHILP